ncbi:LysR family transcriptional regulator [Streptosporangium vulgare]|uniref:LysR family transcriptional regulator n=1 Tax=Streptosporangium vulgare TaxID=46190 RepID=UPI0031D98DEE
MTDAARSLYIAQPALSRAIRDLERELGMTLFARSGRGVVVTAQGRRVVQAGPGGARRRPRDRVPVHARPRVRGGASHPPRYPASNRGWQDASSPRTPRNIPEYAFTSSAVTDGTAW